MPNLQHKRGTRADLNSLASGNNLLIGQIYLITDEDRIAIATAVNAYVTYAKESEVSSINFDQIEGVSQDRLLGRVSSGSGQQEVLTPVQVRALINVEDGATADQTGAELKTELFAQSDTNNFDDAAQTKLTNIEENADVTDAINVVSALDGASITSVTVAADDKIILQDTSDTNKIKTVTAQDIADLAPGGGSSAQLCSAWVNFSGKNTVTIRDSYNVSSITDNGVGDYTINFSTPLANANYSISGMCQHDHASGADTNSHVAIHRSANALQTTSCRIVTGINTNSTTYDAETVCIQVFGGN